MRQKTKRGQRTRGGVHLALIAICCWTSALVAQAEAPALGQLPQFDDLDLSSDGRHLLMVRSGGEYYDLVVRQLDNDTERTLIEGGEKEGLINWCRWANAERVICSLRWYIPAPRLGQITRTRLVAINIDGSQKLRLIPRARNFERRDVVYEAQVQDRIVSWLVDDDAHVLVQLNRDARNNPTVFRLNIYTNRLGRLHRARSMVRRWYANQAGEIRLAIGYRDNRDPVVYSVRGRNLTEYKQPAYDSEIPPQPLGFSSDGQVVYLSMTNGFDRHGIYAASLEDGTVLEEIFRDPEFDVFGGIISHPDTAEPVGISYLRHHPKLVWFDPGLEAQFVSLADAVPGQHFRLVSTDRTYSRFILYVYGGVSPRYVLAERDGDAFRVQEIGRDFPTLDDAEVRDLIPVKYQTQDGFTIPAYLAEPDTPRPHPTVLLPHGGPYSRDSAEFDSWTQFLVSQGYAVLKPNYRGSVGYGEAYMQAGYKQWGLKMQQDLMDGLDWLIQQGIADEDRVCVVGASYGGYTALVTAYKYAEKIRCAVSMAGISDLERMVRRMYNFDLAQRNRERIQESAQLKANSPLRQVAEIDVPVLMLHGTKDTIVRVRQSRDMAAALSRHNKPHRYVEQDGDHFLSTSSQRQEFFTEMQGFLSTYTRPDS